MSISQEKLQEYQAKIREAVADYDGAEIGIPATQQALDEGVRVARELMGVSSAKQARLNGKLNTLEMLRLQWVRMRFVPACIVEATPK